VVLPQGAFARFLHDKPADRQRVLTELLEAGIYPEVMKLANARATDASREVDRITARTEALGDLSDSALTAATARVDGLGRLITRLDELDGAIAEQETARSSARARMEQLLADNELLGRIVAPDTLDDVEAELDRCNEQVKALIDAEAETAGHAQAQRRALEALPERARLTQVIDDHRQLADSQEELARLTADRDSAAGRRRDAAARLTAEQEEAERVRRAAEPLVRLRAWSAAYVEHAALTANQANAAAERAHGVRQVAALIERRDALQATVDRLTRLTANHHQLDLIVSAHRQLAERRDELMAAERAERDARSAGDELAAIREQCEAGWRAASEAHRRIEQEGMAATLAAAVHSGDPCPVCRRPIDVVPRHEGHADLAAAAAAVAHAAAELEAARTAEGRAHAQLAASTVAREACARSVGELMRELQRHAASAGDAQLAERPDLAVSSLDAAAAAMPELDTAEQELGRVIEELNAIARQQAMLDERVRSIQAPLDAASVALDGAPPQPDLAVAIAEAERAAAAMSAVEERVAIASAADHAAATELAGFEGRLGQLSATCEQLVVRCDGHAMTPDRAEQLLEEVDAVARVLAEADRQHVEVAAQLTAARGSLERAHSAYAALGEDLNRSRESVAALGPPPRSGGALTVAWRELVTWAAGEAVARRDRAEQERATAGSAAEKAAGLSSVRRQEAVAVLGEPAMTSGDGVLRSVAQEQRAAAVHEEARITSGRDQRSTLEGNLAAWRDQHDVAHQLAQHLSARGFPQWLLSTALTRLVGAASEVLERLTRHQFGLECSDGADLQVVDHHNADERRPVRSLSGGETFQASLALALALSEQLAGLGGSTRLESIFLDEGFGTLDPDTLETVADTIETLGQDGRMVGLITHVRELAERAPVRFRVTKGERSSSVAREAVA
jgi:exonuclease SbcC